MKLPLLEIVIFLNDDEIYLFIAMICLDVYLWIGIMNLFPELASEARSHKSAQITSEGGCFVLTPSGFMKRQRVKSVVSALSPILASA